MKTIYEAQNEDKHINQLAAQRQIYLQAKRIQFLLFIIAVPLTVAIFFAGNFISKLQTFAAIWGAVITLLEIVSSNIESGLRTKAAKIQELFDCEVLQLPWNDINSGEKPDIQDILINSEKHLSVAGNRDRLINWYFEKPDCLSIPYSRVISQRSNLNWDSHLRRRYAKFIFISFAILSAVIITIGFIQELSLKTFCIYWLLPLMPAYIWGYLQNRLHREAAQNLDSIKQRLGKIWDDIFNLKLKSENLESDARFVQDQIYNSRKNSLVIPERVYNFFQPKDQTIMHKTANQLCEEALELIQNNNLDIR